MLVLGDDFVRTNVSYSNKLGDPPAKNGHLVLENNYSPALELDFFYTCLVTGYPLLMR